MAYDESDASTSEGYASEYGEGGVGAYDDAAYADAGYGSEYGYGYADGASPYEEGTSSSYAYDDAGEGYDTSQEVAGMYQEVGQDQDLDGSYAYDADPNAAYGFGDPSEAFGMTDGAVSAGYDAEGYGVGNYGEGYAPEGYGVSDDDAEGYGGVAYEDGGGAEGHAEAPLGALEYAAAEYGEEGVDATGAGASANVGGASVADILAGTVDVAPYDESTPTRSRYTFRASDDDGRSGRRGVQGASGGAQGMQSSDFVPITRVMAPGSDAFSSMDAESEAAIVALEERRAKRRRRRRVVIALVAILVVGGGAAAAFFLLNRGGEDSSPEAAEALPPTTVTVTRENFVTTIESQGTLQPIESQVVTPTVDGMIRQVIVNEGDSVAAGDPLFIIYNESLEKAANDARTRVNNANSALQTAKATYDQKTNDYNAAYANYVANLIDDNTMRAYEAEYNNAKTAYDNASAELTEATKALDEAQKATEKCTVTAPIAGTVLSINQELDSKGATSPSTANMSMVIADLSQMKVVVQINQMDIAGITAGQEAQVTFQGYPDVRLDAEVESVANAATGDSVGGGGTGGVVTFGVTLIIPSPDPELKTGMMANVIITTQDEPNALVIPLSAVNVDRSDQSVGTVLLLADPETFESVPRTVRLGARDTTHVVVTSGLKEGDSIVLEASNDEALPEDDEFMDEEAYVMDDENMLDT